MPIKIFWVIASTTNAGKTSLASSLIRILNNKGVSALGFKPIAGMRYSEGVKDFHLYDSLHCGLYGSDANKLCSASPLTRDVMPSIIAPSQLLFKNNIMQPILYRMGSTQLGDLTYYKGRFLDNFIKDPNIKSTLAKQIPISGHTCWPTEEKKQSSQFISTSLDYLKSLKPQEIVMEGAGPFLPSFKGVNKVNNVFLIIADKIHYFENINITFTQKNSTPIPIEPFLQKIRVTSKAPKTIRIKKVDIAMIERYYDEQVRQLLINYN